MMETSQTTPPGSPDKLTQELDFQDKGLKKKSTLRTKGETGYEMEG